MNNISKLVEQYKDEGSPDNEAAVRDILTDVMHFCHKNGMDFYYRAQLAQEVFEEEVDESN